MTEWGRGAGVLPAIYAQLTVIDCFVFINYHSFISAMLVEGPAIDVVSVVQLIKFLQPIMHVGVSPIQFDNCISQLARVRINKRFVRVSGYNC
jgi:hypothetical protein